MLRKTRTARKPAVAWILGAAITIGVSVSGADVQAGSTPIAACGEYAAALKVCFGESAGKRKSLLTVPKDRAGRDRLEQTCSTGLKQLHVACR